MSAQEELVQWIKKHLPGFGPDINSNGQLGYEFGGQLVSYAYYGSATNLPIEDGAGFERSLHIGNFPFVPPLVEVSQTGEGDVWDQVGSVTTSFGDLVIERSEFDTDINILGFSAGHTVSSSVIEAHHASGVDISLIGRSDQYGVIAGEDVDNYGYLDARGPLDAGVLLNEHATHISGPDDEVRALVTTSVSDDGQSTIYVTASSSGTAVPTDPLNPDPVIQCVYDSEAGTYTQRFIRPVGDPYDTVREYKECAFRAELRGKHVPGCAHE